MVVKTDDSHFGGLYNDLHDKYHIFNNGSLNEAALSNLSEQNINDIQEKLSSSGLYVSNKSHMYKDAIIGSRMMHGLRSLNNPEYTFTSLQDALRLSSPSSLEIMKLQISLNNSGFDCGKVDGIMGSITAKASMDLLKANPNIIENSSKGMMVNIHKHLNTEELKTEFKTLLKENGTDISLTDKYNRSAEIQPIAPEQTHEQTHEQKIPQSTTGKWAISIQKTSETDEHTKYDMAEGNIYITDPNGNTEEYPFRSGGWGEYADNSMLPGLDTSQGEVLYDIDWRSYVNNTEALPNSMKGADGTGSWLRLGSLVEFTDRGGVIGKDNKGFFGFHTDGNVHGTIGCVALEDAVSKRFFAHLKDIPKDQRPQTMTVLPKTNTPNMFTKLEKTTSTSDDTYGKTPINDGEKINDTFKTAVNNKATSEAAVNFEKSIITPDTSPPTYNT